MKLIFLFITFAIICQCSGQFQRFIVNIVEWQGAGSNLISIRHCAGSVITSTVAVTTASCVSEIPPQNQVGIEFAAANADNSVITQIALPILGITVHPNYTAGQTNAYNVALVNFNTTGMTSNPQTFELYVPRSITPLGTVSISCHLIGWDIHPINPRQDPVTVNPPGQCNLNQPQVYCSELNAMTHTSCTAREATPLVCDGTTISGFLLNNASCTQHTDGRVLLRYHSIGPYMEWIQSVISPPVIPPEGDSAVSAKLSIVLLISAVCVHFLRNSNGVNVS